ncbi:putative nucleotidyltransferase [Halorubrum alkaliphilum]|uniref:Putative nucleotidyltransferase n=1 Tax=Halorubrum alkaliphilum TaxID=261290 RepID=A0A8T4GHR1_9EURY|nr:hypothetical protein [Halorubrum alkaliphilum]MBP1923683.1 putative nucleotidyltransferase [Halorubrum alkaliphilum]
MAIRKSKVPDTWAKRETAANQNSKAARKRIKRDLNRDRSALVQHTDVNAFTIYTQGSYKNYTNTRGSSDLDIIVQLREPWKHDLSDLSKVETERYHRETRTADYGYEDGFRDSVVQALQQYYRESIFKDPITNDGIAIDISGSYNALPINVDVVAAQEYRVYQSYPEDGEPEYIEGMVFQPLMSNEWWFNFPKEHFKNGSNKHGNYRETVRIFKNARKRYNEDHFFGTSAPSYYIECLLYNVPDSVLKRTDITERFDDTLAWLESDARDYDTFLQVSEMEQLFGDENTQWNVSDAKSYISDMRTLRDDL